MNAALPLAAALLAGALAAALATRIVLSVSLRDLPDGRRKLHSAPNPTAGGLGMMAGFVVALAWAGLAAPAAFKAAAGSGLWAVAASPLAAGLLGWLDDARPLRMRAKLAGQIALALAVPAAGILPLAVGLGGPPWNPVLTLAAPVALAGAVLWCVAAMNMVNFMDGANGLAIGAMALALAALALGLCLGGATAAGFIAAAGAAACIGFLPWNAVTGRIFAGDCGALFAGALYAGVALAGVASGALSPWLPALCVAPLVCDTLQTLCVRIARGDNPLSAHASHAYQLAIRLGESHARVAARIWIATAACCGAGLAAERWAGGWATLGVLALALAAGWVHGGAVRRRSAALGLR